MNLTHIPTLLLIGVLASVVLPALSAAASRLHWDSSITGIITALLSAATGFFTEWAHAGDGFAWKTAALTALASWLVAAVSQSKILSGTQLESWLLMLGSGLNAGTGEPDPTEGLDPAGDTEPATVDEPQPETAPHPTPGPLVTGTGAPNQTETA